MIVWPYVLHPGHSNDPAYGACAMDAISWLVHGEHSDAPVCACPVITAFVIEGNDSMPHDTRQRLLGYLHRIAGSRHAAYEANRARILALAATCVFAPIALDASVNASEAATLRALPVDVSFDDALGAVRRVLSKLNDGGRWSLQRAEAALLTAKGASRGHKVAGQEAAHSARWAAETAVIAGRNAGASAAIATQSSQFSETAVWDAYFVVLDEVLNAGPQGEPWSADTLSLADAKYRAAGGLVTV